jgi:hypothetical protein
MAGKPQIRTRVDESTARRIEQVQDDHNLSSHSEAARVSIEEGLQSLGYSVGSRRPQTALRTGLQRLGEALLLSGLILLSLTITWGVQARLLALGVGLAGVVSWSSYRLLGRVEPAVTQRLPSIEVER